MILNILLLIAGCGGSGANSFSSTAPELSYSLDDSNTGGKSNALIFDLVDESEYQFKINGTNFDADIDFDEVLPLRARTELTYTSEGSYSLDLEIYQHDGTPYLADTLDWTYSTDIPEVPIISFSEEATSDAIVMLQVSDARGPDTTEIWVEGDLASGGEGTWRGISQSGLVTLVVSDGDGVKSFSVKVRNKYGNESDYTDISILRTSDRPTSCNAEIKSTTSSTTSFQLKLSAVSDVDVFYAVYGDVKQIFDFRRFTHGSVVDVEVPSSVGVKNFKVQIRNAAGIFCATDFLHEITFEGGHTEAVVTMEDSPLWTLDVAQSLNIRFDHFPSDEPLEMKITGNVTGGDTKKWVDYDTTFDFDLVDSPGAKSVFVQFRDASGNESYLVSAATFLDPYVSITDPGGGQKNVIVNAIDGLSSVTIVGCSETFTQVDYETSYLCTPTAANADVTYYFDDGTSTTASVAF